MLCFTAPIVEDSIASVTQFDKRHPVFCLHGISKDSLVIKQESGTPDQLKFNSKFMTAVDPNAKIKLLTPLELYNLTRWASLVFDEAHGHGEADLRQALQIPGTWFKMETRQLISLDKAVKEAVDKSDKAKLKAFAAALNAAGGLEQLGEIVAADLFNGNCDRFAPTGVDKSYNGGTLKALVNCDNVLISVDAGGRAKPIGLDAFEGHSPFREQSVPLSQAEGMEKWPGRLLADTARGERLKYAQNIVDDLNLVLRPRNRKIPFGSTKRLDDKAPGRLNKGMEEGARKIRGRLREYCVKKKGVLPVGLADRATALGWNSLS